MGGRTGKVKLTKGHQWHRWLGKIRRGRAPGTDEEDAGEEVLAGGQLTVNDWLTRGRIEKRCRWSHTAQQHSATGEKRVVVVGGGVPALRPHEGGEGGPVGAC
jgi:hypothetical protein